MNITEEYIGVKKLAMELDVRCNNFIITPDFERYIRRRHTAHNKIVTNLMERLKDRGYLCENEFPIEGILVSSDKQKTIKLRGRIDILCRKNNRILLFEIKSGSLLNFNLADVFQTLIYAFLYYKNYLNSNDKLSKIDFKAILVYTLEYRNSKIIFLRIKVNEELLDRVEYILRGAININKISSYVPGYYCRFCNNSNCVFRGEN